MKTQNKPILNIPLILQINYKNPEKQRIKNVLLKIKNLRYLEFYELDVTKLDKFSVIKKTNVKNFSTKTILYYQKADLSIIHQFIKLAKPGYEFKSTKKERKQFVFDKKKVFFSHDSLLKIDEQKAYYLDLYGKKYFKIAKENLTGRRNNVVFVVDFLQDLSEDEVKIVKNLGKKLKTNFKVCDFNKLLNIFNSKNPNRKKIKFANCQ